MDDHLTIQIDLRDVLVARGDDAETFPEHVARLAADRLLDQEGRGPYAANLRERVAKIRDEEIREAVRPLIAAAVAAPVQQTDSFGGSRGDAKPLRDVIVEMVQKQLSTKPQGDRFAKGSLIQQFVHEEVERTLRKELQDAVAEARATVIAAVREQAASVITETIARTARV